MIGAPGIHCPECDGGTEVKDSRPNVDENAIRRRRRCIRCGHRFTTFEVIREEPENLNVQDTFKWRRAAEMRAIYQRLPLEDAQLLLGLARRLVGDVGADADDASAERSAA